MKSIRLLSAAIYFTTCNKVGARLFLHVSVILFTGGWYPSMPCRSPGPHPGGKLRGLPWGGGSRPTPRGEVEGSGLGGLQAHTQGGGVFSRPTPGGYPSMHWGRHPPPTHSSCCRQYASYWNAFLLRLIFTGAGGVHGPLAPPGSATEELDVD